MERGLYEALITAGLDARLAQHENLLTEISAVDPADQPHVLARHVQAITQRVLTATKDPASRVKLVNAIVAQLDAAADVVNEDVPSSVELRWRSGEHQAALTS